jgi:double-stranded uracil-DNA glycosylase
VHKPTRSDLEAARGGHVPDLIGPGVRLLLSGINPSLYSVAVQHHFARPGNRFWQALHDSGITPRLLRPDQERELLDAGVGITNIALRGTARADELEPHELHDGARRLATAVDHFAIPWVAVLGVSAYRTAFSRPKAGMGFQPDHRIGGARVWVLPNPSGLNAHYQRADLATAFAELWRAVVDPDTA